MVRSMYSENSKNRHEDEVHSTALPTCSCCASSSNAVRNAATALAAEPIASSMVPCLALSLLLSSAVFARATARCASSSSAASISLRTCDALEHSVAMAPQVCIEGGSRAESKVAINIKGGRRTPYDTALVVFLPLGSGC